MIECTCRYKRPARYDDDVIVRAGIASVGRVRLTIAYETVSLDREVLAAGHTLHVVLDEAGRPQRLPPAFRAAACAARES